MRGPIDYIVVGFKGNKFNGAILETLSDAVDKAIISVLDIALVTKDTKGEITSIELSEVDDAIIKKFAQSKGISSGLISDEDVAEIGEILEPDTAAGLLVIEQKWAIPLKTAIIATNGFLISEGRIHPDAEAELNKENK